MQTAQVIPLTGEVQNPTVGTRRVDAFRGGHSGVLSRQWAVRPDDQRFLTLEDLRRSVATRKERSWEATVHPNKIHVAAHENDGDTIRLQIPDGRYLAPTHWSFGQIAGQLGAPAGYLRTLPAPILQFPLQYGLARYGGSELRLYSTARDGLESGTSEIRASTSPSYGRIFDIDIVDSVMRIAGEGSGWKVPGVMDWGTGIYNPHEPISSRTTTLYASDRDCFIFLCRDTHPIEIGLLPSGDPDYLFPGFIVSNSEVGAGALNITTMFLRAVCCNRNLWGVENSATVRIRHTKFAPDRFAEQAEPALLSFVNEASRPVVDMVRAAKAITLAKDEEEQFAFLKAQNFSRKVSEQIVSAALEQDGRPPRSVWDFVQAVTAVARDIPHQDDRIAMEKQAGGWMKKAAA